MSFKILFYILFIAVSGTNQAQSHTKKLLPLCIETPHCLSSQTEENKNFVIPFKIKSTPNEAWKDLKNKLHHYSRITITHETPTTIHAEATSLVFKFVDNMDFILDKEQNMIYIQTSSRSAHSDFGVNIKRIDILRAELQKDKVIN